MTEHTSLFRQRLRGGGLNRIKRTPPSLAEKGRRFSLRRAAFALLAFLFSMVVLAALAGVILFSLLANGTIRVDLAKEIAAALNRNVGGGYAFTVGATAIQQTNAGPSLGVTDLRVRDGRGRVIVASERATVSVDLLALATGRLSPKRLDLQDLVIHLVRQPDGSIALSAGADQTTDLRLSNLAGALSGPHDQNAATGPAPGNATAGMAGPSAVAGSAAPDAAPLDLPAVLARGVTAATDAMFGEGSVLQAVERFGLENATLVVDDALRHQSMTYRNLDLDADREHDGGITVKLVADGPAGHWSLAGRASRLPDGSRRMDVAADKLSPDELMLPLGVRAAVFETDMPLSFSLSVEVAPDGTLRRAGGPVTFGSGYFRLDDPDHEPAMVDRITADLRMDPRTGALAFEKGVLAADATRYSFTFDLVPPARADAPWTSNGKAMGVFGPERPGEQPIALDRITYGARFFADTRLFFLDDFAVGGPEVSFRMHASTEPTATGFLVKSGMEMGRMPGRTMVRLWPNWVAAPIRAWFLRNLQGGTVEWGKAQLALTDADLELMKHQHSPPDSHSHIEFGVSDAALTFMDGVPPLRGIDGSGVITGDTFTFKADRAEMDVSPGHVLQASDGSFTVPSTDPKPTPAVIAMRVTGGIDALADLLSRDALKPYANLPIDTASVSGSFDGRLTVNMKVGDHVPKEETHIGVSATTKDFAVSKVIGKEPLQNATLAVTADLKGITAKGDGRMFGAPAAIELHKPAGGGPSDASVTISLDDAARQKAGLGLGRSLTGPVTAKITTSFSTAEKNKAAVTLDFTHAAFDAPLPGLKKAAERPAKATFSVLQDPARTQIDNLVFESGSTDIRGGAVLDGNGGLVSAALSQFRLSPGDDAKVDVSRTADGYKAVVKAANLDARPFLKSVTGTDAGSGGAAAEALGKEIDLDLHANLLTGQNAQALTNADLRLVKRGSQVRRLTLSGRMGRGPVKATTSAPGANAVVVVNAKDAGAVLSFLDLYKRMDGGTLDSTLRFADNRIDGSAVVHNFTIREDPAIKKLAEEEIPSNSRNSGSRIDPSAVSFTKLEALFTKTGNKVEVRQGAMFGPQAGATVEGSIDFAQDKVALSGTFVPLYGLNNLFSQIPVVGMLLGGGAHEGLFALNYRIVGSASAPVLTFNPLSALAPGFLRKIFGAIDDAAQGAGADGGAGPNRSGRGADAGPGPADGNPD